MIRELTVEDTGTYQCGVDVSLSNDVYASVELKVKEDLSYEKSISETVHVGGDLNFSCKYPVSLRNDSKFLCKRLQLADCSHKASVNESRKDVNMRKFSLYDDRAKQIFSVSIKNVTKQDSGEYWCGAEAAWKSDHGYKMYFTQIHLTVTEPRVSGSTSKPTQPSSLSSSSSSSPSSSSLSSSLSPSLSSSSSSSPSPSLASSSSSSSDLIQASPPAGLPASTMITVSLILLLLFLIGIVFLTLTLQKRHKMQAGTALIDQCSVQNSGNDQGVPPAVCEYEEIKDTRCLSASDAGTSTEFSTVQLPTISSDPQTLYANTELPTSPCDSAVHSTVQLPSNPPDQDIYSTAQLPTCLSAEKSAEDLTYATVSFYSNATSSNNAVPQMKEDVSSYYASVSHVTSSV
ncbi:polymeric immunoglobulin receptor-like [Pangasianodon hypophthalmus]|uniref:polymeric immunoglobulin receptor-like n=1 Tax=Pangasianodon hypophthalmus TaxID=310915 RepID=UPI002306F370|nr:polymeric immunoglobulin receptor-like [Pangasianodon hypophthalmus]